MRGVTDYQAVQVKMQEHVGFRDMESDFMTIYELFRWCSMTSTERLYDLYKTVEYVAQAKIPGIVMETGVWSGGSMMLAAATFQRLRDLRDIYLFDTFEGHPNTLGPHDVDIDGAKEEWRPDWGTAPLESVRPNFFFYPADRLHFVKGMVEDTLVSALADVREIAICRLDTDWYSGAKIALEVCWPKIVLGGFLIIDDYGYYLGQRKAVDEFFAGRPQKLTRIDYSCRTIQKR